MIANSSNIDVYKYEWAAKLIYEDTKIETNIYKTFRLRYIYIEIYHSKGWDAYDASCVFWVEHMCSKSEHTRSEIEHMCSETECYVIKTEYMCVLRQNLICIYYLGAKLG